MFPWFHIHLNPPFQVNPYFRMDGACPEPGLVGVEDGGDVLQLPLGQLPVVGQQHRGSALHWWWGRTLRFQTSS